MLRCLHVWGWLPLQLYCILRNLKKLSAMADYPLFIQPKETLQMHFTSTLTGSITNSSQEVFNWKGCFLFQVFSIYPRPNRLPHHTAWIASSWPSWAECCVSVFLPCDSIYGGEEMLWRFTEMYSPTHSHMTQRSLHILVFKKNMKCFICRSTAFFIQVWAKAGAT